MEGLLARRWIDIPESPRFRFTTVGVAIPYYYRIGCRKVSRSSRSGSDNLEETKMKKTMIALAVMGAVSTVAQAQSNATLYGIVDVAMRYDSNPQPTRSKTTMMSGMVNTSRWGFRGS